MFGFFGKKKQIEETICEDNEIAAMEEGKMIALENVKDAVFSSKALGDGVAFVYDKDEVIICSPANGTLTAVFPTGHAFGVTMNNGVELLVHIGIDTVEANGKGFSLYKVKQGDYVKAGTPIVKVNCRELQAKYDMSTMLIVTDAKNEKIEFVPSKYVHKGEIINVILPENDNV